VADWSDDSSGGGDPDDGKPCFGSATSSARAGGEVDHTYRTAPHGEGEEEGEEGEEEAVVDGTVAGSSSVVGESRSESYNRQKTLGEELEEQRQLATKWENLRFERQSWLELYQQQVRAADTEYSSAIGRFRVLQDMIKYEFPLDKPAPLPEEFYRHRRLVDESGGASSAADEGAASSQEAGGDSPPGDGGGGEGSNPNLGSQYKVLKRGRHKGNQDDYTNSLTPTRPQTTTLTCYAALGEVLPS